MTVRINFLPRNFQPPTPAGAKEWGVAAVAGLAAVTMGVFYMNAYTSTARMEQQTAMQESQLQGVKALLAQAADIQTREQAVAQAETDLMSLSGREWSNILLTLRDLTPQHLTWTSVKAEKDEIVIKGTSRGLVDVAQLLGGLIDTREVEEVALKYANEQGIPITIKVKADEQEAAAEGEEQSQPVEAATASAMWRQMEFELRITLIKAEGRKLPNGA